jgi:hypothetical protein
MSSSDSSSEANVLRALDEGEACRCRRKLQRKQIWLPTQSFRQPRTLTVERLPFVPMSRSLVRSPRMISGIANELGEVGILLIMRHRSSAKG